MKTFKLDPLYGISGCGSLFQSSAGRILFDDVWIKP